MPPGFPFEIEEFSTELQRVNQSIVCKKTVNHGGEKKVSVHYYRDM